MKPPVPRALGKVRRAPRAVAARLGDRVHAPPVLPASSLRDFAGRTHAERTRLRLGDLRVAVVKAETYSDLFCCPSTSDPATLTLSSRMRTGPVGLYVETDCTGVIVRHDREWSDRLLQQRVTDCGHASMQHFLDEIPRSSARDETYARLGTQMELAQPASSIDWSRFDVVIALDGCVPESVTDQFRTTVWAYYIGEPCVREYRRSSRAPMSGYQLFLNQRFRAIDATALPRHEVEFPYYVQYPGCFLTVLGSVNRSVPSGIMLEHHSAAAASHAMVRYLERNWRVRHSTGTPRNILEGLHESKYFLRLGGRRLWGNALIEAVCAGCLVIGNPSAFVHRDIFTPMTSARGEREVLDRVERLENDPELYAIELSKQQELIRYLAFDRPIMDLLTKGALTERIV